jgi:hypothetical protein
MSSIKFLLAATLCITIAAPTLADNTTLDAIKSDAEENARTHTYDQRGLVATTKRLFGDASSSMASAIENAVDKYGKPNGYIAGEELSAAFIGGIRYGRGVMTRKLPDGSEDITEVHWQGPSAGYDFGASAAKSFFLVYDLKEPSDIFQRFPAVDGNFYLGPGVGVTYKHGDGITLVPVRAGLGFRAGANVGYVHFTREPSWIPF